MWIKNHMQKKLSHKTILLEDCKISFAMNTLPYNKQVHPDDLDLLQHIVILVAGQPLLKQADSSV